MTEAVPESWTWADGVGSAGPAVLVDVDGVIADGSHRQHHLRQTKRDWRGFFGDAHLDPPIEGSQALLEAFGDDLLVVLLTARPHTLRQVTIEWLNEFGYRWDLLILRARSDGGLASPDFKRRSVDELRTRGFEPVLALDDDQRNVDMFRSVGVPSLYVHSGYYEA